MEDIELWIPVQGCGGRKKTLKTAKQKEIGFVY
jgi:hypothetical protein